MKNSTIASLFVLISFFAENIVAQSSFLNKEFVTESGLKYKVLQEGKGERAKSGDVVLVHYVGKLLNDTVFDSSVERGKPFKFTLGNNQVILGWEEGVALMNVGDKMLLTIPPALAYGPRKMGKIPAYSTLKFEVELLKILPKAIPFDVKKIKPIITKNGIEIYKTLETKDSLATKGKTVLLHYSLYLEGNKKVDSSVDKDMPIRYESGKADGFDAWNEAFPFLRSGEKARLKIPYQLGFGEKGVPPQIPEKATLYYDIEILEVID
jgi:peptidylprolyl isomerase